MLKKIICSFLFITMISPIRPQENSSFRRPTSYTLQGGILGTALGLLYFGGGRKARDFAKSQSEDNVQDIGAAANKISSLSFDKIPEFFKTDLGLGIGALLVATLITTVAYLLDNFRYSPSNYKNSILSTIENSLSKRDRALFELLASAYKNALSSSPVDFFEFLTAEKITQLAEEYLVKTQERSWYKPFQSTNPYYQIEYTTLKKNCNTILRYARIILEDPRTTPEEFEFARAIHTLYTQYLTTCEILHQTALITNRSVKLHPSDVIKTLPPVAVDMQTQTEDE